jgi:hypothetical protein
MSKGRAKAAFAILISQHVFNCRIHEWKPTSLNLFVIEFLVKFAEPAFAPMSRVVSKLFTAAKTIFDNIII